MLFSGIDLHKRTVAIHTLDAAGTVVRAAHLPAQRRALTLTATARWTVERCAYRRPAGKKDTSRSEHLWVLRWNRSPA